MSRLVQRKRQFAIVVAVMVVLVTGGAAIRWGKTRLFPDLGAEASAAYSRGNWHQTASLAHRRLKEAPDDAVVLRLAARAAARQDQDQKAIAIYNRFVVGAIEPEDFFLLGRALGRTGQVDSAFKAYETALEGDPDHAEALDAVARLYLQNDRYSAAAATAERLARHPAWEARAQLMLGTARAEIEDHEGASAAFLRWRQLDHGGRAAVPHPVAPFHKLLARSLLKSRQPDVARDVVQTLLAAGPDPEASWLLSRCYIQLRDWKQAAAILEQHPSYRALNPLEFEPAPYIGALRCAQCHRRQYDLVLASRHATTFAHGRELLSDPVTKSPIPDPGNPQVTHRLQTEDGSLVAETRNGEKVWRAVVDYAFGSADHYTTYVGRDDRSRSFMIRMSHYDSPRGAGWDLSTGLPVRPNDPEEYLGKKMLASDGARRCLYCHTTNLHAILTAAGPEAADHAIGCERCHGPGGHHVAAVEAGFFDSAIANPSQAPAAAINDLCSKCHSMQRPDMITAPRTDPIWLRFQALTLSWSRCLTESEGTISCVTCHDPHRNRETSPARNEAKCLGCHGGPTDHATDSPPSPASAGRGGPAPAEPPFRRAKTACPIDPAKRCIECHMPKTWQEGTHSFKTDHFIRVHERAPGAS